MRPRRALVVAVWAALCGTVSAQAPSGEPDGVNVSEEREQGSRTRTAAADGGEAAEIEVEMMGPSERRASALIGAAVISGDGEEVGEIDDLIVSTNEDEAKVVLAVGGLFGIGRRLISVPLSDVEIETDGESPADEEAVERVRVAMSVDELRGQPLFRYEKDGNEEPAGGPF